MKPALLIEHAALVELQQIVDRYDDEYPGRADRFLDDVKKTIEQAALMPDSGQETEGDVPKAFATRSFKLNRFPYRIVTASRENGNRVVVAVAPGRVQDPEYWIDRLR